LGQNGRHLQSVAALAADLWTFPTIKGNEPTNNAAEHALRQSVIQRNISHGVQFCQDAICRSRWLTVSTTLRQRVPMCGSSWSKRGLPITAVG
jgi:hypothetical protein